MNDPPSNGNENVIDIFVLSNSETETPMLKEHLEQRGYRVTLFPDATQLIETLHLGNPNLLICDTTTLEQDGFEVCRQIKADNDHWMIPVLVLTGASDLGDLLKILDCNADNFIAHPCNFSYLLSLIEGMLTNPVERQTADQIKTQFKIQHDDRIFVITADRRKLLELLLSSFEIAVIKSDSLIQAKEEIAARSAQVKMLEESVNEHTRVISIINVTLQTKEQKIKTLSEEIRNKEEIISDKNLKIEQLEKDLDKNKSLLATAEEHIRMMLEENEEKEKAHRIKTDELDQQVSALIAKRDAILAELASTKHALEEETRSRTNAERDLAALIPQIEHVEKTVRTLTLESEQLKVALAAEKDHALSAEQETKEVRQAKSESERDLTRQLEDLDAKAKQQAIDITRQEEGLESGKNRIISLEVQLSNLNKEKEHSVSVLQATADNLQKDLGDLQARFDTAIIALQEKESTAQSLTQDLLAMTAAKDSAEEDLESVSRALAGAKSLLETQEHNKIRLEKELAGVISEKEKVLENLNSANGEIAALRLTLAQEKEQGASAIEILNAVIREREEAFSALHGTHEEIKTDLDAHKDDLEQVKRDLAAAVTLRTTLEKDLDAAAAQIKDLKDELNAMSQDRWQSGQQARSLADELEQVKGALESERRRFRASEENLKTVTQDLEHAGQELHRSIQERDAATSALETERLERQRAEEYTKAAVQSRDSLERDLRTAAEERERQDEKLAVKIQKLKEDFEQVLARQRMLEEQVSTLKEEKDQALDKAAALTAEIDQARTALADEWENHMDADERLAAAEDKQQSPDEIKSAEAEKEKKRFLIVKEPATPLVVTPGSTALVPVAGFPVEKTDEPKISCVEDLFEEDESAREITDDAPGTSPINEPATGEPAIEPSVVAPEDLDEDKGEPKNDIVAEDEEPETIGKDDETGGPAGTPEGSDAILPPADIAFNRAQWFDILKWSHHSGSLTQDQRIQIVRMGRLIQKGRKLTRKQEDQVREMIILVQKLGYRFT